MVATGPRWCTAWVYTDWHPAQPAESCFFFEDIYACTEAVDVVPHGHGISGVRWLQLIYKRQSGVVPGWTVPAVRWALSSQDTAPCTEAVYARSEGCACMCTLAAMARVRSECIHALAAIATCSNLDMVSCACS